MSSSPNTLRVATRGSRLALRQTELVIELLRSLEPGVDFEIVTVTTTGDRDRRSYAEIGGRGLFVREVEEALLDDRADLAVHSAKDLTSGLAPGCVIAGVPARAPVEDVVLGAGDDRDGGVRLTELRPGSKVGTSSMRRRALLAEARRDLDIVEFRGNLDTRLEKVERGDVDAAIVAAAGLERLGLDLANYGRLDPDVWTPAPAQGALAVEALDNRTAVLDLVAGIDDDAARAEVTLERAFSAVLEGGCTVPLGCL
ncbi:MAG TPA: hydroxymethylbilane synthase, partial [Actinomycetota bacterium]|nr:hydroxymethylbilane synthase [Actinomycetota bacterium]